MSDAEGKTPRVILARHGETEWAKSGRFTGISDIPLTEHGKAQVLATAHILVGPGKLIDSKKLIKVFVSPRVRATATSELLLGEELKIMEEEGKVEITDALAEMLYGDYEGLKDHEIRALRKERGLDTEREWNIWADACENGETIHQLTTRLDGLINEIRALQAPNMHGEAPADILLVAHGHLLRAFVKRWLGYEMEFPLSLMLEPGGVGILSYEANDVKKPALMIGMGFPLAHGN